RARCCAGRCASSGRSRVPPAPSSCWTAPPPSRSAPGASPTWRASTGPSAAGSSPCATCGACSPAFPPAGPRPWSISAPAGGDIPRALVRWARRARRPIRVIALDLSGPTLEVARRTVAGYPEITLVRADALAAPFREHAVDVAISSLTLHHLEPAAATVYLEAMGAMARVGVVVNDLARSRLGWAAMWL